MKILFKDSDLFFEANKSNLKKDLVQIIVLAIIFSFLTTFTVYEGWTTAKLTTSFAESFIGILIATLSGILILIIVLTAMVFKKFSKTRLDNILFVIAYAATPALLIGWIPHGIAKLIGVLWSLVFIEVGLEVKMKKTQKQATLMVVVLAVTLAVLMLFTQTYIISPI